MPNNQRTQGTSTTSVTAPGMDDVLGAAKWLFNSGAAWTPNTTSQVTPFSTQTKQALGGMQTVANSSVPAFAQNFNRIKNVTADGGLNNLQDEQVARYEGLAGGNGFNPTQQNAADIFSKIANGSGYNGEQQAGLDWLKGIAGGSDMATNPWLEQTIAAGSKDIANADNLMASVNGRLGSGSHQGILEKNIGDFSTSQRFADYNNQLARRDAAIRDYFNMGTTGAGQKSAAAGSLADLGTTGYNQRENAISSLFDAGTAQRNNILNGTSQLQSAYDAKMDPYKTLGQVGQIYEGQNAKILADKTRIENEKKAALSDPINWLASITGGFAGSTGTQTATKNPIMDALAGALAGYGTFGGPKGALFGGLTGAFA